MSGTVLQIRLLGAPEARIDGEQVKVDTRKAIALLAYLARSGSPVARDRLIDLLWTDSPPDRGRGALRRTLSSLRSGLNGEFIQADREKVALQSENVTIDVDQVDRAFAPAEHGHDAATVCPACIPNLVIAAEWFRGDFLEGFYVKGAPEFEQWQGIEYQHWRDAHTRVLERLSRALAADGRYEDAADTARRLVELDELNEAGHRHLMLILAWSGDRAGSVDAYRGCVRVMQEELGVPPLEETTELYQAILDEDVPRAPAAKKPVVAVPIAAPPPSRLVNRDREWESLQAELTLSRDAGRVLELVGEAGIGKTRLLEALSDSALDAGMEVLSARAFRDESEVPYGVIAQLISAMADANGDTFADVDQWALAEVSRLEPSLQDSHPDLPEPVSLTDATAEYRFLTAIEVLVRAADRSGLVIAIDDAQWLDPASDTFLTFLAHRIRDHTILLVTAYRPEDLSADRTTQRAVGEQISARNGVRIELSRLSVDDLEGFLTHESRVSARQLHRMTGGLPLFVVEQLASDDPRGLADGISEAVLRRVNDLSPLAKQLIGAASVIGGHFTFGELRSASGRTEDETLEGLEELVRRNFLKQIDLNTLGFVNEPIRGIVYGDTGINRRRIVHARFAVDLAASSKKDARITASAAHHYREAGDSTNAALEYELAGDLAREIPALAEAAAHYEAALASGHTERSRIHLAMGDLAALRGSLGSAETEYEAAAATADAAEERGLADHRLGEVLARFGNWDRAEDAYARAVEVHPDPARVLSDWSLLAHRLRDNDRALELAHRALGEASGDPTLARVYNVLGVVSEGSESVEHLERSLELGVGDAALRIAALNNLSIAEEHLGNVDRAIELAREALALTQEIGDRHREAALHNRLADLSREISDVERSMDHQKESARLFADIGTSAEAWEPEIWLLRHW